MKQLRLAAAVGALVLVVLSGMSKTPSKAVQPNTASFAPPILCPSGPGTCPAGR